MAGIRNKIAVIDNEYELAILYAEALDAAGYCVESYCDPIAALVEVTNNHPQYALVISDNRMPGLNGIELISQLQKKDNEIKFILISGFGQIGAMDLNFTFLSKPIRISILLDTVNVILNTRKRIDSALISARKIKSIVGDSGRINAYLTTN
jgi:two-component system, NtrC family, C4-dicarboxylate transport response regulator DctD